MDDILSKKHYRRAFYLVVSLVLVLSMVTRFLVLPIYDPILKISIGAFAAASLDTLMASLLITVAIGSFVFWLRPEIVKRSTIEVVEPKQINPLLKHATTISRGWIYKGACGRHTRASTLPRLAEAARVAGIGRDITICILNPMNSSLCSEYAIYRRSLKSRNSGTTWTRQVVQEEIIATAITAMKFIFTEPLLRIRVFFIDNFSAFRLDIADEYVVVTKEDSEASALKADAGTYFYDSYKDDVRLTERQGRELKCCGKLEFKGDISDALLREAILCANIADDSLLSTLDVERIRRCVNSPTDPY
jgi:hypothetical protein